jgi:hypothetical protein
MSAPSSISQTLWATQIPLHVTHRSSPTTPFITSIPRFSYLSLLLPRLSAFFDAPCSSFHFEDVQLRNLAVGLLADLYAPSLPWRLVVDDGPAWDIGDTFLNSVKEVSKPSSSSFSLTSSPFFICYHFCLSLLFPDMHSILPAQFHTYMKPCSRHKPGRLCSLRQRQPNHENVKGPHHPALERRH